MTVRKHLETLGYWDFARVILSKANALFKEYFNLDEVLPGTTYSMLLLELFDWLSSTYDKCTTL